jgi:hypothetical protein
MEPTPFDPKWFSSKFNGPGIRYEVGVSIFSGHIIWVNGGVPCGEYPDLVLARSLYTSCIREDELTVADNGYRDDRYFVYPQLIRNQPDSDVFKTIRARHETVNSRLKAFKILSSTFRHSLDQHPACFYAVANIVQATIIYESPLFPIF